MHNNGLEPRDRQGYPIPLAYPLPDPILHVGLGSASSRHEFPWPQDRRLTDEEWRSSLFFSEFCSAVGHTVMSLGRFARSLPHEGHFSSRCCSAGASGCPSAISLLSLVTYSSASPHILLISCSAEETLSRVSFRALMPSLTRYATASDRVLNSPASISISIARSSSSPMREATTFDREGGTRCVGLQEVSGA